MSNNKNGSADAGVEDSRLDAWLADAPRLATAPGFQQRVMRALDDRKPRRTGVAPILRALKQFLLAPHTLRWNVASLAAVGAVAVLALGLGLRSYWPAAPGTPGVVKVRFALYRPDATAVTVAGDFSGWRASVPLSRQADGVWRAEVKLAPGEYEYAFVVDGRHWVQDPKATRFRDDGFGARNALLSVPAAGQGDDEG